MRFPIEAGASIELCKTGETVHATTADMSGGGVLVNFNPPVQLVVGDQVICEFRLLHDSGAPLPYWGVGDVVRVEGCRVAIELSAGGFSPSASETACAKSAESEANVR